MNSFNRVCPNSALVFIFSKPNNLATLQNKHFKAITALSMPVGRVWRKFDSDETLALRRGRATLEDIFKTL